MRKLMVAAAVAAVATLGLVGRAGAQEFYPKTSNTPARVQGAYSYPAQSPYYPGQSPYYPGQYPQYPTTSSSQRERDRYAHRDRDRDRDDRRWNDEDRGRYDQQDWNRRYAQGSTVNGVPSRVPIQGSASHSSTRSRDRDRAWDR